MTGGEGFNPDLTAWMEQEVEESPSEPLGELSPFYPKSWFCPVGILKVLKELEPKLPSVEGCLFLTFTVDPSLFLGPEEAFERARDRIRRIFYLLRKGIKWNGKLLKLDKPYCVKLEFHGSGWPHFHSIFLTKRFLPGGILNHLWNIGRTNVERISNETFRYLLKYVTKSGEVPEWVKGRSRIRIFQASRGFYKKRSKPPETAEMASKGGRKQSRKADRSTIGERLEKWKTKGVLKTGKQSYQQVNLNQPYLEMAGKEALSAAIENRYLGNLRFSITKTEQLEKYLHEK